MFCKLVPEIIDEGGFKLIIESVVDFYVFLSLSEVFKVLNFFPIAANLFKLLITA
jgi:hypothetical protein